MKNTRLIVIIALVSLALLVLLYVFFKNQAPELISSSPLNNSVQTDYRAPIILRFNEDINLNDMVFEIIPSESFEASLDGPSIVKLAFDKPPKVNTAYRVNIKYKNKQLGEINFKMAETQRDLRFNLQVQKNMSEKYPLMAKTPYDTPLYRVVYASPLTLEISIKNLNVSTQEAIDEIKEWVKSMGGDVEAHKYIIASPLSSPAN